MIQEAANQRMQELLSAPADREEVTRLVAKQSAQLAGGFIFDGSLLLWTQGFNRPPASAGLDPWGTERFVNDLSIEFDGVANWRVVAAHTLKALALSAVEQATNAAPGRRVQVDYYLQADPEADESEYRIGGLHVYQVREPDDDLSVRLDRWAQPGGTITWLP